MPGMGIFGQNSSAHVTYHSSVARLLGAFLAALPLIGCGDSSKQPEGTGGSSSMPGDIAPGDTAPGGTSPGGTIPADTAPDPSNPSAGLSPDRPDPCRGVALPADQHFVAAGLCVSAVAFDQEGLRQITFTSNGDLIGVHVDGQVVRFRDSNNDGRFQGSSEIVILGYTDGNGNNAHVDEQSGYLYAGSPDGVVRWPYGADTTEFDSSEDVVVNQPSDGAHPYHTVHVYDGWLYVHSGSAANIIAPASPEYDTNRALLKRFPLSRFSPGAPFDWSEGEVVASGLRNMVGYSRGPDGNLYGVVNGIDALAYRGEDVRDENPGEGLVRLDPGSTFGFPYCFTAQNIETADGTAQPGAQLASEAQGFTNPHDDAWCEQNSKAPLSFLPAHTAPLDIAFYTPGRVRSLPEAWSGGAFVTEHGSGESDPSVGHNVVFFPFGAGHPSMPRSTANPPSYPFTVVFGGGSSSRHVDGEWGWQSGSNGDDNVRPVGVAVSPVDGALYVSTDRGGVLYRIGVKL
jgi:glucose/arabinose dehydrogenase